MKKGQKPTVRECNHLKTLRLNPFNWLISKKMTDQWLIIHRVSGNTRLIPAP